MEEVLVLPNPSDGQWIPSACLDGWALLSFLVHFLNSFFFNQLCLAPNLLRSVLTELTFKTDSSGESWVNLAQSWVKLAQRQNEGLCMGLRQLFLILTTDLWLHLKFKVRFWGLLPVPRLSLCPKQISPYHGNKSLISTSYRDFLFSSWLDRNIFFV